MPKENKVVHAKIGKPVLIRKTLLESAILATEVLKSYEKIKRIRAHKKHYIAELKRNLLEIKQLILKLEETELPPLPTLKRHISRKTMEELKEEKEKRKEQEKLFQPRTMSEQLDVDITKLQEKLKKL